MENSIIYVSTVSLNSTPVCYIKLVHRWKLNASYKMWEQERLLLIQDKIQLEMNLQTIL